MDFLGCTPAFQGLTLYNCFPSLRNLQAPPKKAELPLGSLPFEQGIYALLLLRAASRSRRALASRALAAAAAAVALAAAAAPHALPHFFHLQLRPNLALQFRRQLGKH